MFKKTSNTWSAEPPNVEPPSESSGNQTTSTSRRNNERAQNSRTGIGDRGNPRHNDRGISGRDTNKFKGETLKMNGNVFQFH